MTKRRITTIEEADATMEHLAPMLYKNGYPWSQVRRVLQVVAFQRGEIDRLQGEVTRLTNGEVKKPGFVELVEQKRK
jgi:hypothetical protein